MQLIVFVCVFCCLFAVCSSVAGPLSPFELIKSHQQLANSSKPMLQPISTSSGSLVFSYFNGVCDGPTTSASGFTLGSCVSADGATAISYSSCTPTASGATVSFRSHHTKDCSDDAPQYSMDYKSCDGMKVTCSSNVEAWKDFSEITYHYRFYYSSATCARDMGMWTGQSMACTSAYNMKCAVQGAYSFDATCGN